MKLLELCEIIDYHPELKEKLFDAVEDRLYFYEEREPESYGQIHDDWEEKYGEWSEIHDSLEELISNWDTEDEDCRLDNLADIGDSILDFHITYGGLSRIKIY